MTHPFRTHRLALFATTAAMAAGAVLVPTTAFAATATAAPHAVVADSGSSDRSSDSTLLWTSPRGDGRIKVGPGKDRPDDHRRYKEGDSTWKKGDKWGKKRPGKGGSDDRVHVPKNPEWRCITAPCGPPGSREDSKRTGKTDDEVHPLKTGEVRCTDDFVDPCRVRTVPAPAEDHRTPPG
ncbi:hypothetical protein [Streptomyces yangpuensis]|uniref:hypothetical protein n=1 Tax=Streptomyces yangpuensis TaxID=1648182 RepID=UPI00371E7C60